LAYLTEDIVEKQTIIGKEIVMLFLTIQGLFLMMMGKREHLHIYHPPNTYF